MVLDNVALIEGDQAVRWCGLETALVAEYTADRPPHFKSWSLIDTPTFEWVAKRVIWGPDGYAQEVSLGTYDAEKIIEYLRGKPQGDRWAKVSELSHCKVG